MMKKDDTADQAAQKAKDQTAHWLKEIGSSLKREADWRKSGRDCVRLYEGKKDTSFNILYSNVETLSPALYSATPKPAVMRRYKNDEDQLAKAGAEVINRSLTYQMDTNGDCSDFDELMDAVVLAALVPGRGQVWYRYEAKFEQVLDPMAKLEEREGGKTPDPKPPLRRVVDENIEREMVPWDLFTHGYARQWKDVPWVGRCHVLTKDELMERFPKHGGKVTCTAAEVFEEEEQSLGQDSKESSGMPITASVWEIWDKTTMKVWFVTEGYKDEPLEVQDDPLKLTGFFPCPQPLLFTRQLSGMTPQTLYAYYIKQAQELEDVTQRLKGLIKAMRVRGMYNAMIDDIAAVLDAEENKLLPITNAATLEGKGLANSIWLVPIQDYVPVIQELWTQREQLKKVIYELTGISDIIRGSTVASETATAQDIKSRWGTLRLQTMQKRVQRLARSMIRIETEIMCGHFAQKKFQEMTDLEYPTNEQKANVQAKMQEEAKMAQVTGEQPQPPDAMMQLWLASPTWEEICSFLKSTALRMFRLDIETDSTLADSIKADQEEIAAMLTAVTQLIQGLTPAVQGGFLSFETAKAILSGVCKRFRLGSDLETALEMAKPPPPPQEDQGKAEAQKLALEAQKQQMEMQAQQAETARVQAQEDRQAEMAKMQADQQMAAEQMKMDMARMQMELEMAQAEHALKMRELQLKAELAEKQVLGKLAVLEAQAIAAKHKAEQPAKPTEA